MQTAWTWNWWGRALRVYLEGTTSELGACVVRFRSKGLRGVFSWISWFLVGLKYAVFPWF